MYINLNLRYPAEQLWVVLVDLTIIEIPTVQKIEKDSCGGEVGSNKPDPAFKLPQGARVAAIVHTHPNETSAWPRTGDYDTAKIYPVYGIHQDSAWVVRKGAAYNSAPETLSGSAPVQPRNLSGKSCTMKK